MATAEVQSVSDQLKQLNEAKKAVLSDPQAYYSQIMVGILPLASPNTNIELRRWATNFIAEAFATPTLPGRDKEGMSLQVVGHLRALLENHNEDPYVLRSAIQAAASIYPHAMRWMYVCLPCSAALGSCACDLDIHAPFEGGGRAGRGALFHTRAVPPRPSTLLT